MCAARMVSVQVSHLLPGITTGGFKPSHHLFKHGKSCAPCNKRHGSVAWAFVVANLVTLWYERGWVGVSERSSEHVPQLRTNTTSAKIPEIPKQRTNLFGNSDGVRWRKTNENCLLDLVPMTFIQFFGSSASHENEIRYSGNTYNTVYNVQDITCYSSTIVCKWFLSPHLSLHIHIIYTPYTQ